VLGSQLSVVQSLPSSQDAGQTAASIAAMSPAASIPGVPMSAAASTLANFELLPQPTRLNRVAPATITNATHTLEDRELMGSMGLLPAENRAGRTSTFRTVAFYAVSSRRSGDGFATT
jgi:hypothetical protein